MMRETRSGLLYLLSVVLVVAILVYMAEYKISPELTRFLTPIPPVVLINFFGITVPALGFSQAFPMVVAAVALGYLAMKVKGREYRVLFIILVVFSLVHVVYHAVRGTGAQTGNPFLVALGRDLINPIDIWILVAFGILYLRRELKVGG